MYKRCHICDHSLGSNDVIPHMLTGSRLAYDVIRGRLWVVCPSCGEWNLTPLEERWEAIEECEQRFQKAEARASTPNVGISRATGVELIRIGPALRDELANWRYGPRFHRRRRRARILTAGSAIVGGTTAGAAILVGALASGAVVALWTGAVVVSWAIPMVASLTRRIGPGGDVRVVDARGRPIRIGGDALHRVALTRYRRADGGSAVCVRLPSTEGDVMLRDGNALVALSAVLPRLNWRGARPLVIRRATELLDRAEEQTGNRSPAQPGKGAWEWLALGNLPRDGLLTTMDSVSRLALEMAVSEEIERQAMLGEAQMLAARWTDAENVAGIADDMFLPERVRDWIRRHRPL